MEKCPAAVEPPGRGANGDKIRGEGEPHRSPQKTLRVSYLSFVLVLVRLAVRTPFVEVLVELALPFLAIRPIIGIELFHLALAPIVVARVVVLMPGMPAGSG